jgi:Tol biopolymer transport system component
VFHGRRRRGAPYQRRGSETDPAFSPDGTRIAFTGEYDGNVDVFVIPARAVFRKG